MDEQNNDNENVLDSASAECKNCAAAKEQADEYKQGWQRAVADYQNLQKEMTAKRSEWAEMSEQYILEEFIRPLSLSLRLFGNVFGEDALIAVFTGLGILSLSALHSPIGLPLQLPFMLLAMLTGTIQALVFSLLSTIYISLMLPHDDYEEGHAHEVH